MFESVAPLWLWAVFAAIVVAALFIDFVVLNKQGSHEVGIKEAINWSIVWVALSFMFNGLFWWAVKDTSGDTALANTKALEFLTGYLIEKSLAVDNIFVFLMIFTYFAVPAAYQKRVLMIGIIGAIVLRTIMILVGGWLLQQFHWILYIFGAFLILTGVKMWWAAGKEQSLDDNPALKLLRKILPVSKNYDGEKFLLGGAHRCDLCGGFHSCDFCDHQRSLHRVDQQRVCDSRFTGNVFLARSCG
jgi:tellurite resistance protein TerC